MPLDVKSLDSGTPTAKDGRTYPSHLKRYEAFDDDSANWRGLIQPIQKRGGRPHAWKAGPRLQPPQAA